MTYRYIPYLGTFFSHGTPVWPWPVIYISYRKILKRVFPRTRHCWSTPLGELTRRLVKKGALIEARTVNRDWSANPHSGTSALRAGALPGGDRLTCR